MKKVTFIFTLLGIVFACNSDYEVKRAQILENGAQLAEIHCISCHKFPDPSLLDQKTWKNYVLPRMGNMLGIYNEKMSREALIHASPGEVYVKKANIYPEQAVLEKEEWAAIVSYYLAKAPEELEQPSSIKVDTISKQFQVRFPPYQLSPPSTTMVQFSSLGDGFFIGDANSKSLYQFDQDLNMQKAARVKEGAVSLHEMPEALFITVMGTFSPSDAPDGFLMMLPKVQGQAPTVLIDSLQRPVHTSLADLDGNGYADFVISEFAKWTGGLSWWQNNGTAGFRENVLRSKPGAIKTAIHDFNGDNQPDILALFGQGDEGFFLYTNLGNGQFQEERLIELESTYGSSSFELVDFNGDQHLDIVYTAGDNADYPPILKPYHGIYIFENDGQSSFKESLFLPLPGAYATKVRDFDQDGDMDIAAISFFPDFQQSPEKAFVFYENQGKSNFIASTFPQVGSGRWITMDAGDIDEDGDTDLILGSLTFEVIPKMGLVDQWVENGIPFVVLENNLK